MIRKYVANVAFFSNINTGSEKALIITRIAL